MSKIVLGSTQASAGDQGVQPKNEQACCALTSSPRCHWALASQSLAELQYAEQLLQNRGQLRRSLGNDCPVLIQGYLASTCMCAYAQSQYHSSIALHLLLICSIPSASPTRQLNNQHGACQDLLRYSNCPTGNSRPVTIKLTPAPWCVVCSAGEDTAAAGAGTCPHQPGCAAGPASPAPCRLTAQTPAPEQAAPCACTRHQVVQR